MRDDAPQTDSQPAQQEQSQQPAPAEGPAEEPADTPSAEPTAPTAEAKSTQEAQASQSPDQLVEQLRNNWQQLRASVSKRNKIAGIMLTEARVLGLRDDTLVLGHTTGALAERLNAPANNKDIVAVVSEESGHQLAVNCIVGTDPEAAGFSGQKPKPQTWNPRAAQTPQAATRETGDDDQESESPRDYNNSAPSQPADKSVENQDRNAPPAQEPSGWGAPRALGGDNVVPQASSPQQSGSKPTGSQPSPTPPAAEQPTSAPQDSAPNRTASNQAHAQSETPVQAPAQAQPAQDDWRARIAQAKAQTQQREEELRNSGTFSDGRPLPPDPGPDSYPEYESVPPEDAYPPSPSQPAVTPQQAPASNSGRNQGGFGGGGQQQAQAPAPSQQQTAPAQRSAPPAGGQQSAGASSASYSREAQENEMMDDAREQGQLDRRSATEVAMELLERELGARKL